MITPGDEAPMSGAEAEQPIFKSTIDDLRNSLTCRICLKLLYEPFTTSCGHTFCYECLNHWFKGKAAKSCPDCRERIRHQPAQAYAVREMVSILCRDSRLLPDGEEKEDHDKMRDDMISLLEQHKKAEAGIFEGAFSRPELRDAKFDEADRVWRCPCCLNELEEMYCPSCDNYYDESGRPTGPGSFWDSEDMGSDFSDNDVVGDVIDVDAIEEEHGPASQRTSHRDRHRAHLRLHELLSGQHRDWMHRAVSDTLNRERGSSFRPINIASGNSLPSEYSDSDPSTSDGDISRLIDDEEEEEGGEESSDADERLDSEASFAHEEDYPSSNSDSLGIRSPSLGRASSDHGDEGTTPSPSMEAEPEDTLPILTEDREANFSDPEEDSADDYLETKYSLEDVAGHAGGAYSRSEGGQEKSSDTISGDRSPESEEDDSNDNLKIMAHPSQRNRKRIRAVVLDDSDDEDESADLESEGRSSQRRRIKQTVESSEDETDDDDIRPASSQRTKQGIDSQISTASSAPLRSTFVASSDEDEGPISTRRSRAREFSVTHPASRIKAEEAQNWEVEALRAR